MIRIEAPMGKRYSTYYGFTIMLSSNPCHMANTGASRGSETLKFPKHLYSSTLGWEFSECISSLAIILGAWLKLGFISLECILMTHHLRLISIQFSRPWTTNQLIQLSVKRMPFVTTVLCYLTCQNMYLTIVV